MQIDEFVGYILMVVLGIVPIVNPFSTAPVFISMTANVSVAERHKIATMACVYMCTILLTFLLLGVFVLQFFGISLMSVRLGGGLIIAFMGFQMLFPRETSDTKLSTIRDSGSIAFTPLALPMLSGPGSISVVLGVAAGLSEIEDLTDKITGYGVVAVGIIVSSFICWLVLWSAGKVIQYMGKSGIDAATKLMGFILVCIGTEFVISGWAMI